MATRRAGKETEQFAPPDPYADPLAATVSTIPRPVMLKLIATSLAMISCPLLTYFITYFTVFEGNSTYSGAAAAIAANIVLIIYIIIAMREDEGDQAQASEKTKGGSKAKKTQ